jgi:hypothetical protein
MFGLEAKAVPFRLYQRYSNGAQGFLQLMQRLAQGTAALLLSAARPEQFGKA